MIILFSTYAKITSMKGEITTDEMDIKIEKKIIKSTIKRGDPGIIVFFSASSFLMKKDVCE